MTISGGNSATLYIYINTAIGTPRTRIYELWFNGTQK